MITNLETLPNMYNVNYDVITNVQNIKDLNNKLFCTFTNLESLDELVDSLKVNTTLYIIKCLSLKLLVRTNT